MLQALPSILELRTYFLYFDACSISAVGAAHTVNTRIRPSKYFIVQIEIHSSCEIEYFVKTHLCKVCVIPRSRSLLGVYILFKNIGRRLPLELQCSLYQGQQGDVNQSVRGNYETRFRGGQSLTAVECTSLLGYVYRNNSLYRVLIDVCERPSWHTLTHLSTN